MSTYGHRTKWHINIAENVIRLSWVHERYRQTDRRQTDGRWPSSRSQKIAPKIRWPGKFVEWSISWPRIAGFCWNLVHVQCTCRCIRGDCGIVESVGWCNMGS